MPRILHPDAAIAIRAAIGLVFLGAAAAKFRHFAIFRGVLANYRLLPQALVLPAAGALPAVEALIGAALVTDLAAPWAGSAAAALLLLFAFAMAINLARGREHIDCGCFQGTLKQTLRWSLVARNAVMALLAAAAAAPLATADAWTIANGLLAGVALFLVVQGLNALWAIVPPDRRAAPRRTLEEGT